MRTIDNCDFGLMTIWMGEAGGIRILNPSSERLYSHVDSSDVNVEASRFEFRSGFSALVTGDRIWIRRITDLGELSTDNLDFVDASGWDDGVQRPDGEWYVNTDTVGGIRLFKLWVDAINDERQNAVLLSAITTGYRVSFEVVQTDEQCLAQTVGWVLNTDREVADYTSLGDGYRQQMSTIVSGSGELDCLFDFNVNSEYNQGSEDNAMPPIYLHKLALRQEIGAKFKGVFLMKQVGACPVRGLTRSNNRELFYYAECVITEVATELIPEELIHSKIRFVTTGPIQLLFNLVGDFLLQEQLPNDKILKESGFGILLETPVD